MAYILHNTYTIYIYTSYIRSKTIDVNINNGKNC